MVPAKHIALGPTSATGTAHKSKTSGAPRGRWGDSYTGNIGRNFVLAELQNYQPKPSLCGAMQPSIIQLHTLLTGSRRPELGFATARVALACSPRAGIAMHYLPTVDILGPGATSRRYNSFRNYNGETSGDVAVATSLILDVSFVIRSSDQKIDLRKSAEFRCRIAQRSHMRRPRALDRFG